LYAPLYIACFIKSYICFIIKPWVQFSVN